MNIFYGDNIRWFIGNVVEDNDEELKLGRVQVRIYGIHDNEKDIPIKDLPWATVMSPATEQGISGLGYKPNIKNGAQVFGIFLDGKLSQAPLVLGSLPKYDMVTTPISDKINTNDADETSTMSQAKQNWTQGVNSSPPQTVTYGVTNGERAFNFFSSKGFSNAQASGIVGNLGIESTAELDPSTNKTATGGSMRAAAGLTVRGIGGWSPNRYRKLIDYANTNRLVVEKLQTQLDFIIHELNKYPQLGLSQLKTAPDVAQATSAFATRYLGVPRFKFNDDYPHKGKISIEQERIDYALGVFEKFA